MSEEFLPINHVLLSRTIRKCMSTQLSEVTSISMHGHGMLAEISAERIGRTDGSEFVPYTMGTYGL